MAKAVQEKLTFKEHDQLDRERYANFIIELAQHAEGKEGSYTIAVNAPYGSGKTMLLKMMISKIKDNYSTTTKPLIVIYYNAWQYDFFNEPLVPLATALFEDEELADENDYDKFVGRVVRVSRFIASLGNNFITNTTGYNLKEAYEASKIKRDAEKEFFEYKHAIEDLRDSLSNAVELYGEIAKMIVIIDELDRCKPDFAIKTLKITKHLLSNEKIVFLYALDMSQLQKTVEKAYGSGMDSSGYLIRFFDYISTIPEPNICEYLMKKVKEIEDAYYIDNVYKELEKCYRYFSMTLRDVDRIMATYNLIYKYFVKYYENPIAHMFYLHLLCLKYKRRSWFESITNSTLNKNEEFTKYYKEIGKNYDSISYRINKLAESKGMTIEIVEQGNLRINGQVHFERYKDKATLHNIIIRPSNGEVRIHYADGDGIVRIIKLDEDIILGYVLFPEDLKGFDMIKARSIPEYIHQHMEFFNFNTGLKEDDETKNGVIVLPPPSKK